jgi:hypothetical protein
MQIAESVEGGRAPQSDKFRFDPAFVLEDLLRASFDGQHVPVFRDVRETSTPLYGVRSDDLAAASLWSCVRVRAIAESEFLSHVVEQLPYDDRRLTFTILMTPLPLLTGSAPALLIRIHAFSGMDRLWLKKRLDQGWMGLHVPPNVGGNRPAGGRSG